jgi:MFS family permease
MIGFGFGGILMGRLADRFGVMVPVLIGIVALGLGFIAAGVAPNLLTFAIAQCLLIGALGNAATFVPLVADASLWFSRRRGIAVAICASGNYRGRRLRPCQSITSTRRVAQTFIGVGISRDAAMPPPRCAAPAIARARFAGAFGAPAHASAQPLGFSPGALQAILCLAGLACCVAMAMPQVHIVAYCGDLGFGPARGAQMLSLMLGCGIVSRLASGWICDHIGGLRTLLLGSLLQGVALALFLLFDGLASLYVISALFGPFSGRHVPSYAIIVRDTSRRAKPEPASAPC